MSKYRVKNCPAYIHKPLNNHDKVCLLGNKVKSNHKELYVYCEDCTNCIIKQVIEKCKEHPFKDCACGDEILQLFDIEILEDSEDANTKHI